MLLHKRALRETPGSLLSRHFCSTLSHSQRYHWAVSRGSFLKESVSFSGENTKIRKYFFYIISNYIWGAKSELISTDVIWSYNNLTRRTYGLSLNYLGLQVGEKLEKKLKTTRKKNWAKLCAKTELKKYKNSFGVKRIREREKKKKNSWRKIDKSEVIFRWWMWELGKEVSKGIFSLCSVSRKTKTDSHNQENLFNKRLSSTANI